MTIPNPPSFRKPCIECGKMHETGFQNMKTGAMIERFDKCKDCFMNDLLKKCKAHWDQVEIDHKFEQQDVST